jgi:hypothetical protein
MLWARHLNPRNLSKLLDWCGLALPRNLQLGQASFDQTFSTGVAGVDNSPCHQDWDAQPGASEGACPKAISDDFGFQSKPALWYGPLWMQMRIDGLVAICFPERSQTGPSLRETDQLPQCPKNCVRPISHSFRLPANCLIRIFERVASACIDIWERCRSF